MNKAQKVTTVIISILSIALVVNQVINNFNFSI